MSGAGRVPVLQVITPAATPEEIAAIVAAVGVAMATTEASAVDAAPESRWVSAARLRARRAGLSRGEWRLSGQIGRRSRA